jgi:hypothetical protein
LPCSTLRNFPAASTHSRTGVLDRTCAGVIAFTRTRCRVVTIMCALDLPRSPAGWKSNAISTVNAHPRRATARCDDRSRSVDASRHEACIVRDWGLSDLQSKHTHCAAPRAILLVQCTAQTLHCFGAARARAIVTHCFRASTEDNASRCYTRTGRWLGRPIDGACPTAEPRYGMLAEVRTLRVV